MTDKPEPNKEYALTGKSGDACIANGSSWKESEVKKKPETSHQKMERMVKSYADDITEPKTPTLDDAHEFMDGVYNIEWITHQDHSYKAARLLVAGGGPNIWVNLQDMNVEGYWGCNRVTEPFIDNIGLDDYLEELHESK
jgi:hypothetical protein